MDFVDFIDSTEKIYCENISWLKEKISRFSKENTHIISDFDDTFTIHNSYTSWSLFANSGLLPEEYIVERNKLFKKYNPYEIDQNLSDEEKNKYLKIWWQWHLNLFIKYKLNKDHIREIVSQNKFMDFRDWVWEFLSKCSEYNIPSIILSAWLTNTIKLFLQSKESLFENIKIVSNNLFFDEVGSCIWFDKDHIIYPNNKDEKDFLPKIKEVILEKENIILLGDSISVLKMIENIQRNKAIKICFLNSNKLRYKDEIIKNFDIVVEDEQSDLGLLEKILKNI